MAGILDGTNQLFNAGMGILSANQRSPVYQNPVNSMQKGLMQGQLLKRQQQQDMMKQQEFEQAKRMKELQMQEIQAKMSAVPERKILNDQNGVPRYQDTGEVVYAGVTASGSANLPVGYKLDENGVAQKYAGLPDATTSRQTEKDVNGRLRYLDNGELVFNGIEQSGDNTESDKNSFDRETKLRNEFTGVTGEFAKQNDAYGRILASTEDPSAAGDLSLIFNYMKLLDPTSVVRESEFATAENSGSIPERIRAKYNKVLDGERLADEQRADFLDRSGRLYKEASSGYKKRVGEYERIATSYKLDPSRVIFNRELYEPTASTKKPNAQIPGVSNDADYNALPPGSVYTAPDGSRRTKK